jgi:CRP-like cAMP-binding protein
MEPRQLLIEFIRSKAPISYEKAVMITDFFIEKEFSRNEMVLTEGKVCNEYHFLCSGFMRSWTTDLEGRDVTTAFYPEKQIVCELLSFFKRIPSQENIQALSDCNTLTITFEQLNHAFHSLPEFREMGRSILVNFYADLKQRMLATLQQTAEQRYKHLITTAPEVFQHASLKHIASYLGITDTSLSRIRKEFTNNSIH